MTATVASVPFTVPSYTEGARAAALRVIDSGWTTTGPECAAFEREFAEHIGARQVVAVASCTQAIELCLRDLRLPPGSAVLTPSLTFCGAVAAIVHAGYRPVLVDINPDTLTPDERTIAKSVHRVGKVEAMVVCHLGGYPVDAELLAAAAGLPPSRVVEDAAHGPGGAVTGRDARAACFSFYATKNLPIGEGGAIATNDDSLADRMRSARQHGMTRDAWRRYLPGGSAQYDVEEIGFKANLTDLQSAIGRAQLHALPRWQARRTEIAARYDQSLSHLVRLPRRHPGHAWHLYQIRVRNRNALIAQLTEAGIATSIHFIPVHRLSGFARLFTAEERAACPATDEAAEQLLSLPLYPALTEVQQETVIEALTAGIRRSP